jgi:hypothetical protein
VAGAGGWCRGRGAGHPGAPPGHGTGLAAPPCHCKQNWVITVSRIRLNNVLPATDPPNKNLT